MESFIFFVEGIHDANCIARIISLQGFKEINNINDLPQIWMDRIPRSYPFIENKLSRHIPMPSHFRKNNLCIVIVISNGCSNIINEIDLYLSNMTKSELRLINGVCAIFDADEDYAKDSFDKKFKKYNKDMLINKKDFKKGVCKIKGININLFTYFLPDNYSNGNLEDFLLECASIVYKDLLLEVNKYVKNIDEKYKYNWSKSSINKVKVGCIANIFQPGGANQTSIRHDNWISKESIENSIMVMRFYQFIENIIQEQNM